MEEEKEIDKCDKWTLADPKLAESMTAEGVAPCLGELDDDWTFESRHCMTTQAYEMDKKLCIKILGDSIYTPEK